MEFLMTYGWAILAVLAAIAALSYFGVLDFSRLLPERCVFPSGITCIDRAVIDSGSDTIEFVIKNNIGVSISLSGITDPNPDDDCSSPTMLACVGFGCIPGILPVTMGNNQQARANIGCDSIEEGRFSADITLNYINLETGLTHPAKGEIRGKAIALGVSYSTDQTTCQNAENGDLCEGLDILFGEGYQAACCSEHELCCG